jgi:aminopeptidase N
LTISYTAKPDERSTLGGSAAITSDKGLYFINPDGASKTKPQQIWTQGETESNSFWMPTVDKPNERCTQEMYITVEDKYKTLSNGLLVSSKKNTDGTRTDYWKMDKPHAPYLFMMAIGEFAVVKDKWRGIDVDYYVEPKFEKHARAIYPHTTEMLEFFSNKLNYPYPWSKYSQVVVRDYVSGAMENTTAVIFGEFMQKTSRELLDDGLTNEKVVAHEMFHHWFGDLVTTESWANLTLNEGFANYSEYLWMEQKHGRDAADDHLMNEQMGYLLSAPNGGHPLIHYGYNDREEMFDAHSYNKGGCILHMLRELTGDEAFFAALNRYLKKNEYTDVEAAELRLAFEDVTGQDWQWFFNQWFLEAGHPDLVINYNWIEATKKAVVNITQIQGDEGTRIFNLPLAIDVYDQSGKAVRHQVRMTQLNQEFSFDAPAKPALVNVDATKTLLCVKADNHTPEEWAFQYRHAPLFRDRWEALEHLQDFPPDLADAIALEAMGDKSAAIRRRALGGYNPNNPAHFALVEKIALTDSDPQVRTFCMMVLGETKDKKYIPVYEKSMANDQPYSVASAAFMSLGLADADAALRLATTLQSDETEAFTEAITNLYAEHPAVEHLAYFDKKMDVIDDYPTFPFFTNYQKILFALNDAAQIDAGLAKLKSIAMNLKTSEWRRFAATKAIADLRNTMRENAQTTKADALDKVIAEIKANETDQMLKTYYDGF